MISTVDAQPANGCGLGNSCAEKEEAMRGRVRSLLARMHPARQGFERRTDLRHPYPFLVRITPVDDDGLTPIGETVSVVGKDLTDRGIGFFHQEPLPYRRAIVSFESGTEHALAMLIDLSWCRFTRHGWYDSGGRFLQCVDWDPTDTPELSATA